MAPSDRKIMFFIFSALIGTTVYQLSTVHVEKKVSSFPVVSPTAYGPSLAVADCQDCLEVVGETCEMEIDSCADDRSCEEWVTCTEECISVAGTENCYVECDLAHSDTHTECSALKNCMCDVCIGQCTDMCMADG